MLIKVESEAHPGSKRSRLMWKSITGWGVGGEEEEEERKVPQFTGSEGNSGQVELEQEGQAEGAES